MTTNPTDPKVPSLVWNKTTHPDDATENLREEVHEMEELLDGAKAEGPERSPQVPVAIDPAAEKAAYAELLGFLKGHPEDGTEIVVLSEEEFAAESFEPNEKPREPHD